MCLVPLLVMKLAFNRAAPMCADRKEPCIRFAISKAKDALAKGYVGATFGRLVAWGVGKV